MKKYLWVIVLVVAIGVGIVSWQLLQNNDSSPGPDISEQPTINSTAQSKNHAEEGSKTSEGLPAASSGRYTEYDAAKLSDTDYTTHILFFHAPWCPECRAFETAIQDSTIPNGIQFLKVDYDSAKELRKQHGVTTQTTFVRVDDSGMQQAKWIGYGKDKSIDAIIENTR